MSEVRRRRRHRHRRRRRGRRTVAGALAPYQQPLAADSQAFATASVAYAQAPIDADGGLGATQVLATLAALDGWQREVQRARARVKALDAQATGHALAVGYLSTLADAIGLMSQSLSSTDSDPHRAADLAARARQTLEQANALADRLERVQR
jgi:hypothetical protein